MIRIATVEHDKQVQARPTDHIRRYERQFGWVFELSLFDGGDEIVSDYRAVYDIILLFVLASASCARTARRSLEPMSKSPEWNELL